MIRLVDGPAEGSYAVRRAPLYLRAVIGPGEQKDVLDQLEDEPAPQEAIHVYKRVGDAGQVHLNFGVYATGEYRHVPGVDGEAVRDFEAWRRWVVDQIPRPV